MRQFSLFLLIFSIFGSACAQEYFMYYGGKKKYFNVSPNKILVHCTETTEVDSVKNIVKKNTSLQVSDVSRMAYKGLSLVSLSETDTAATKEKTHTIITNPKR